jgi:hypothetical protein
MSPEKLEEGYAWCYERLFSHASIWRRRPADWRAVPPYLAMSYLYKRSNRLWRLLILHRLTGPVWRPLVECTRRRHLRFRRRLAAGLAHAQARAGSVVSAGVETGAGSLASLPNTPAELVMSPFPFSPPGGRVPGFLQEPRDHCGEPATRLGRVERPISVDQEDCGNKADTPILREIVGR